MKKLLEIRKILKSRKPNFVRGDSNKEKCKTRLKWKKPRGLHNKRRLKKKGHQKNPSVGFRSPKQVRALDRKGLVPYLVRNVKDLKKLDKDSNSLVLASGIGLKKKMVILEECLKNNLQVSNVKNITLFLEESKTKLSNKKKSSEKRKDKKKREIEAAKKKKEEEKKDKKKETKEMKKEILESKQKEEKNLDVASVKKDTTQSKGGHQASNVPGTKQ